MSSMEPTGAAATRGIGFATARPPAWRPAAARAISFAAGARGPAPRRCWRRSVTSPSPRLPIVTVEKQAAGLAHGRAEPLQATSTYWLNNARHGAVRRPRRHRRPLPGAGLAEYFVTWSSISTPASWLARAVMPAIPVRCLRADRQHRLDHRRLATSSGNRWYVRRQGGDGRADPGTGHEQARGSRGSP